MGWNKKNIGENMQKCNMPHDHKFPSVYFFSSECPPPSNEIVFFIFFIRMCNCIFTFIIFCTIFMHGPIEKQLMLNRSSRVEINKWNEMKWNNDREGEQALFFGRRNNWHYFLGSSWWNPYIYHITRKKKLSTYLQQCAFKLRSDPILNPIETQKRSGLTRNYPRLESATL